MALKTVGDLKDSVSGLLQGVDINDVTDADGALERAARTLAQQADIPEMSGRESITLYNGVYNYECPEYMFGAAVVDLRPQGVDRSPIDFVYKKPGEQFDRTKAYLPNGYMVTFESNKGERILRVATPKTFPRTVLDTMSSTSGWTAAGSASGLTTDTTNYYQIPASLRFLLTGSSTGTLTKTLDNSLDIPTFENVAVGFLAIQTPSITDLTSIYVRVGSDASNYDTVTATEGFLGAFQVNEWLLVAFDMAGATSTGTPDWTAIDYIQVGVAHTATIVNFRVGGFWLSLPAPHELLFQSSAIFKHTNGTVTNDIENDNDEIILSDAPYNLFLYESAISVAEQTSNGNADVVTENYKKKLYDPNVGLYAMYRGDNPSQELRMVGSWYDGDDIVQNY